MVLGSYYWRIFLSIELPPPNPVTGNFQRNGRLNGWARNIPDFLAGICASSVRPSSIPISASVCQGGATGRAGDSEDILPFMPRGKDFHSHLGSCKR